MTPRWALLPPETPKDAPRLRRAREIERPVYMADTAAFPLVEQGDAKRARKHIRETSRPVRVPAEEPR